MYDAIHGLAIGFHGCDAKTCKQLINVPNGIHFNNNVYDWLGNGMYFWENDLNRAQEWAQQKHRRGQIQQPAVLGAIIDLGNCCDFLSSTHTKRLSNYYRLMKKDGLILPENEDVKSDPHQDKLLRKLDCSVIEYMHRKMKTENKEERETHGYSDTVLYDSVRSAFLEGAPIFPGAGLKMKSHIQICVRNPNCILGFFLPRINVNLSLAA
jgi:hypothetical protein